MTESALVPAAQRDPDAWITEVAGRAVAYAASLLRDTSLAEDIVQDCFCRLLQKRADYDLERDGVKLLFRSITNACINATTRRQPVVSLHAAGGDGTEWDLADNDSLPPDGSLIMHELEQAVEHALALLPIQQKAALQLKSLGHTQQEIAVILETTVTNAGVLVHRARQAMAESLAPFLGGPRE